MNNLEHRSRKQLAGSSSNINKHGSGSDAVLQHQDWQGVDHCPHQIGLHDLAGIDGLHFISAALLPWQLGQRGMVDQEEVLEEQRR